MDSRTYANLAEALCLKKSNSLSEMRKCESTSFNDDALSAG